MAKASTAPKLVQETYAKQHCIQCGKEIAYFYGYVSIGRGTCSRSCEELYQKTRYSLRTEGINECEDDGK